MGQLEDSYVLAYVSEHSPYYFNDPLLRPRTSTHAKPYIILSFTLISYCR